MISDGLFSCRTKTKMRICTDEGSGGAIFSHIVLESERVGVRECKGERENVGGRRDKIAVIKKDIGGEKESGWSEGKW